MALIENHLLPDEDGQPLEVPLNYEIIALFSEGLYQSPHKAVEELVSNSYDAGAQNVRILLPRDAEDGGDADSLIVLDDGVGMDADGFEILWRIAKSPKAGVTQPVNGRLPIGQFGIGKLAAYVLAWRLTHVSKTGSKYFYTSMDFRVVQNYQLNDSQGPLELRLHQISKAQAKAMLGEVEDRDPDAWAMLFGRSVSPSWTAAVMSDFKDLYRKLEPGTLRWVLRTGLPLATDFRLVVDSELMRSPIKDKDPLFKTKIGGNSDDRAKDLADEFPGEVTHRSGKLQIEGIAGNISGEARLYEQPLTRGKAGQQYHRSNGFFVSVRGRIINLEDELFGLEAQNHSAWSRFILEVDADGLRDHLLSSREGLKASRPVQIFRRYLHLKFNECRSHYEAGVREQLKDLDLETLLRRAPHALLSDPLADVISELLDDEGGRSYYIELPAIEDDERSTWFEEFGRRSSSEPISDFGYEKAGPYSRLARWDAGTLEVTVNKDHPFMAKLETHSRNDTPLSMVSALEVATEVMLRNAGMGAVQRIEFLEARDRLQRVLAGQQKVNAADCLRELDVANENEVALERAVGRAFSLLGFDYVPGGENQPGDDGFLTARLGVIGGRQAGYTVVYDAKSTDSSTVPADKCDFGNLEKFRDAKDANYGFFVAKAFAGQAKPSSSINKKLAAHDRPATLLTLDALKRLVSMHLEYGLTLTRMEELFRCDTVGSVDAWLSEVDADLRSDQVPLRLLLNALEDAKGDPHDTPTFGYVRARHDELHAFGADRLEAALAAVQTLVGDDWIEIDNDRVVLHQTPDAIIDRYEDRVREATV